MGLIHPHWRLPLLLVTEEPFGDGSVKTCYCPFHPISLKPEVFLGYPTFPRSSVLKHHLDKSEQNC